MKEGQYSYRDAHNLAEYRVEQCHSRRTLGRDARFKFQLLLARKTQSTAFTLYMKNEADRMKWIKALNEAMYFIAFFPTPQLIRCINVFFLYTIQGFTGTGWLS